MDGTEGRTVVTILKPGEVSKLIEAHEKLEKEEEARKKREAEAKSSTS